MSSALSPRACRIIARRNFALSGMGVSWSVSRAGEMTADRAVGHAEALRDLGGGQVGMPGTESCDCLAGVPAVRRTGSGGLFRVRRYVRLAVRRLVLCGVRRR